MSNIPVTVPTGAIRYNTDSNKMECFNGTKWYGISVSSPDLDGGARGCWAGGNVSGGTQKNEIDYVTIASTGNAADFGDLTSARRDLAACSSPIRGVWCGGDTPTLVNTIDYVEILTTCNAVDFGDQTVSRDRISGCSNAHGGL